jgi:hypothetical protein
MANSRVGQYRLEFPLTGFASPVRSHVQGIWVAPTTAPTPGTLTTAIDLQLLGGGTETLQAVALDFAERIRPMYGVAVIIAGFSLWKYVTENSRDFITAGEVVTTASVGAGIVASQSHIQTFRCAGGAVMKHVFLEAQYDGDTQTALAPDAMGASSQRFAAWVLSSASPCIGLDNTFPVAPLKESLGENEKVWRKINRQ